MKPARLVLQSGEVFQGECSEVSTFFGEVVFNTGMVGYMEAMTDPSYRGQLLCFTYPLMGNYGVPDPSTWESSRIQVAGVMVSETCEHYQHREAQKSLLEICREYHVPLLTGIDTRRLTKTLSHHGVMPGCITTEKATPTTFIDINTEHLVKAVSITAPIESGHGPHKVIAIDCGMKQNIIRHLQRFPLCIKQVPFDYDFTAEDYDAVFISNGPGDPARCVETIAIIKKILAGNKPVFGICLGAQLMSIAIGAKTYKLPFGHRAQNHPCMSIDNERCYLTSQNHGFTIDEKTLPTDWETHYRHVNDGTVQGIRHKTKPFSAVQFHPESGPGPVDTAFLFDEFYQAIAQNKNARHI